jgi:hypothetical protein
VPRGVVLFDKGSCEPWLGEGNAVLQEVHETFSLARSQWFTPVILAEVGMITVCGQPQQIVHEIPHLQNIQSKIDWRCGSSCRAPALQRAKP